MVENRQRSNNVWEVYKGTNRIGKITRKSIVVYKEYSYRSEVRSKTRISGFILVGSLYTNKNYKCFLCPGTADLDKCLEVVSKDLGSA